ncbi:MAG: hypothetical protein ACTSRW_13570 [Candidatus Helarchaeota archaeon]
MDWNQIRERVLPLISPDEKELEQLQGIIKSIKTSLTRRASELRITDYRLETQGSTGQKQTMLKGASDIDLFVILKKSHISSYLLDTKKKSRESIRNYLAGLVDSWFVPALQDCQCEDVHISYAEHPYASAHKDHFEIDIVGCFDLKLEEIRQHGTITAVDRTPHHTRLIKNSLTSQQIEDVRLLKSFFITCRAYGDKSAIGQMGFTGFSAEILIYHFNSIECVFENFESLKNTPIDFFSRTREELLEDTNFVKSVLVIIDPTDPRRNLAASISERSYEFVSYKIDKFRENPSEEFFLPKKIEPLSVADVQGIPATIVLEFQQIIEDVHYTEIRDKLYSFGRRLSKFLELEQTGERRFGPVFFEVYFEPPEFALILACESSRLAETYRHKGPHVNEEQNVRRFKDKHPNAFREGNFYWIETKREMISLKDHTCFYLNSQGIQKLLRQVKLNRLSSKGDGIIGKKIFALFVREILPFLKEKKKF